MIRIMQDLPGVQGIKQSQGDLKLMADCCSRAAGYKVYSAVDALLYSSFALGAHGTIAATPAALPGVCVSLWNTVQAGDHEKALEMHKSMLAFWNTIVARQPAREPKTSHHAARLQRRPPAAAHAAHQRRPARPGSSAALDDVLRFDL